MHGVNLAARLQHLKQNRVSRGDSRELEASQQIIP